MKTTWRGYIQKRGHQSWTERVTTHGHITIKAYCKNFNTIAVSEKSNKANIELESTSRGFVRLINIEEVPHVLIERFIELYKSYFTKELKNVTVTRDYTFPKDSFSLYHIHIPSMTEGGEYVQKNWTIPASWGAVKIAALSKTLKFSNRKST